MELTHEQQQAIEHQKSRCIFCQIVDGKMSTNKVYEDDLLIGILDINPATKGHVLLMPKEHYPIAPLIPAETFKHLFSKLQEIDGCVKEALLCKETTIVVANGMAAGQQSTHFMLHIIPRDSGDSLGMLDVEGKETPASDLKEVKEKVGPILKGMLQRNLHALGYISHDGVGGQQQVGPLTKDQVLKIIDANPQIKEAILSKPKEFKKLVPNHPQLAQIFKEVDINQIIADVTKKHKTKESGKIDLEGALK